MDYRRLEEGRFSERWNRLRRKITNNGSLKAGDRRRPESKLVA